MKKNIIIFGSGQIAELAYFYFTNDTNYQVTAFSVDREYITDDVLNGLPVVPFEEIEMKYPPSHFDIFVALAYTNLNNLRKQKYLESKAKGYFCVSYISSRATVLCQRENIGENCFILEDNTIQPFVKIGNNVTLWSGNHIGHHSTISDHVFIASHVVVSGNVMVGERSFIGVNATLRNNITIGAASVIGAGCWINKNTDAESVYKARPSDKSELSSNQLEKL